VQPPYRPTRWNVLDRPCQHNWWNLLWPVCSLVGEEMDRQRWVAWGFQNLCMSRVPCLADFRPNVRRCPRKNSRFLNLPTRPRSCGVPRLRIRRLAPELRGTPLSWSQAAPWPSAIQERRPGARINLWRPAAGRRPALQIWLLALQLAWRKTSRLSFALALAMHLGLL